MKIMSDARKFGVKIEVKPERTRQAEKGTPELEKDKNLMEVSDELKKSIVEPLIHAADELEKNQENEGAEEIITSQEPVEKETPDEVGNIISEENIEKEEVEAPKPEDKTQEIIDERNEVVKEETVPETPEEQTIEEFPDQTEEIIEEENIEQNPKKKLEKDKPSGESKVSSDPNEILGR
jgi:hypothetical protein